MNTTMCDHEDKRFTKQTRVPYKKAQKMHAKETLPLADFVIPTTDIWRYEHPTEREFTHYSNPHQSFARLDYFFATPPIMARVMQTEIQEISLTDHAPVTLEIRSTRTTPTQNIWRFPTHLTNNKKFQKYI